VIKKMLLGPGKLLVIRGDGTY